jgi:hypothetical protein
MSATQKEQTLQVLKGARQRLIDKGWAQGASGGPDGPNCMMGALDWESAALRGSTNRVGSLDPAYSKARAILCGVIRDDAPTVWNDDWDRTAEQVIAAFDAAIAKLEEA